MGRLHKFYTLSQGLPQQRFCLLIFEARNDPNLMCLSSTSESSSESPPNLAIPIRCILLQNPSVKCAVWQNNGISDGAGALGLLPSQSCLHCSKPPVSVSLPGRQLYNAKSSSVCRQGSDPFLLLGGEEKPWSPKWSFRSPPSFQSHISTFSSKS